MKEDKICTKEHPYDHKDEGWWQHPSAEEVPTTSDYYERFHCPICDLTFKVELPE